MHNATDLLSTTDAREWADEFVRTKNENGWTSNDIDEELMIAWFANAMFAQEMKDNASTKCTVISLIMWVIVPAIWIAWLVWAMK